MAAESGDRGRALELFDQAIRLDPRNAEALFNRGKIHRDAGLHDQAVADLRAAIASSPGLVKARINLAIALMDVRDLAGAETELLAALQIEPRDPRALTNLGEVLRATGRAPAAVNLYREALDADPTYSHAAARLGVTLENLGDRQGALAAYREFLARGTTSPTDREAVLKKVNELEQAPGGAAPTR
jgi:tetratricopeptide (TPR) repeat protein